MSTVISIHLSLANIPRNPVLRALTEEYDDESPDEATAILAREQGRNLIYLRLIGTNLWRRWADQSLVRVRGSTQGE